MDVFITLITKKNIVSPKENNHGFMYSNHVFITLTIKALIMYNAEITK